MTDDFEERLYSGSFLCIYALLQHLLDHSLADSVAVLQRSGSREWKVMREICAKSGKNWADLLKDSNILDALETLDRQAGQPVGWERPAFGGAEEPILICRVWSPDREYLPHTLGLAVAIFHPRGINRDPLSKDYAIIRQWHRWTIEWFAIAGYRHLALRELWSGNKPGDPGPIGIGTSTWGRWPMSFLEISKLIEHEVKAEGKLGQLTGASSTLRSLPNPSFAPSSDTATRNVSEIIKGCLEGLHLDDGGHCQFPECVPPRCHGEQGRKEMAPLARLSPFRLLHAEHGEMKPWKAGMAEYEELVSKSVSDLFIPTQKLDSLNGKFLTINFARNFWSEWLDTEKQREFIESPAASPDEKAKMFSCSTRLAHFALQHMPRDIETMEALLWAVNKYTGETLGLDPRMEIGSHLLHLARNEPALHVLKPHYRDHFFHAIEVCFLGHLLLDMEYEPGKQLCALVQKLMNLESREEVLRTWYLAALLHDVGYAVDVLKGAEEALKFFECSEPLKTLTNGVEAAIDTLSADLKKGGFVNIEHPGRDHGVVAAEHLEQLIHVVSEKRPPWPGYDHSVQAIRVHNLHSETVAFRERPLSFLLILCDTIQEWNRPHLRYSTAPSEILTSLLGVESHDALEAAGLLRRVSVNIKPDGEKLGIVEPKESEPRKLEFDLEFGPAIQRNAGVFNLWLVSCSNLQRLNLDELPFEIVLRYKTPQFRDDQGNFEHQMHRLKQAAEETHLSVLADWFPDGGTNLAVQYRAEGDKEILDVDLRDLTKKRRIRADMDAIRERLQTWKHYSEDRDFAGDYAPVHPGYPFRHYAG
jgi:hypothetical protein